MAETEIRMRSLADELASTHADRGMSDSSTSTDTTLSFIDSRLSGAAMEVTALTQSHQQQLNMIEKERDNYKLQVHQLVSCDVRVCL